MQNLHVCFVMYFQNFEYFNKFLSKTAKFNSYSKCFTLLMNVPSTELLTIMDNNYSVIIINNRQNSIIVIYISKLNIYFHRNK